MPVAHLLRSSRILPTSQCTSTVFSLACNCVIAAGPGWRASFITTFQKLLPAVQSPVAVIADANTQLDVMASCPCRSYLLPDCSASGVRTSTGTVDASPTGRPLFPAPVTGEFAVWRFLRQLHPETIAAALRTAWRLHVASRRTPLLLNIANQLCFQQTWHRLRS